MRNRKRDEIPVLETYQHQVSRSVARRTEITSEPSRADAVLDKLGDGTDYGAPFGFVYYHLVGSNVEQAADWAEKAIEQRDPTVRFLPLHPLAKDLRLSARWPALAKMMNLPLPS